jgi:purine-nucleoside phosphorylase
MPTPSQEPPAPGAPCPALPDAVFAALRGAFPPAVDAVLVLGSGLGDFTATLETVRTLRQAEIPDYPASTVAGHAGAILHCRAAGRDLLVFQGRLHGYEGYSAAETAYPGLVAAAFGARRLIATNAAGGLAPHLRAGDLMLLTDYLVLPLARRMGLPLQPLGGADRAPLLDDEARTALLGAALEAGVPLAEGVYGFCSGPTYETRAEIAFLRRMGADAVGMSTVPELLAARAAGVRTVGISCITNATSTVPVAVSHDEVTRVAAGAGERMARLLHAFFRTLPA